MSTSSATNPSVSPPNPKLTPEPSNFGSLEFNGKKYKVTVIYTDETGKVVNGPKDIDLDNIHNLTKELLDKTLENKTPANITIDLNGITTPEAKISYQQETTKLIWNSLYDALITSKKAKTPLPTEAPKLHTKVILEPIKEASPVIEELKAKFSASKNEKAEAKTPKELFEDLVAKHESREKAIIELLQGLIKESIPAQSEQAEIIKMLVNDLPYTNDEEYSVKRGIVEEKICNRTATKDELNDYLGYLKAFEDKTQ